MHPNKAENDEQIVISEVRAGHPSDGPARRAASLAAYSAGRRKQGREIFARGIARGELAKELDCGLAADMLAGFIWHRRLTGRIERDPDKLRLVARQMVRGLLAPER